MKKYSLKELILMIEQPNQDGCMKLYKDHHDRFRQAPGSLYKHQAWYGGYIDHLEEGGNFAIQLYEMMGKFRRKLPFALSDALLSWYLHDLEKAFKYVDSKRNFITDEQKFTFILEMCKQYNITLTDDHINALRYVHGEGVDYNPSVKVQKPLGAFIHMCDTASARIWFDYPKIERDAMRLA